MTELLRSALERIRRLPPEEQDRLACLILEELESEAGWQDRFRGSPEKLAALADRAREEIARGEMLDQDPATRRRG